MFNCMKRDSIVMSMKEKKERKMMNDELLNFFLHENEHENVSVNENFPFFYGFN